MKIWFHGLKLVHVHNLYILSDKMFHRCSTINYSSSKLVNKICLTLLHLRSKRICPRKHTKYMGLVVKKIDFVACKQQR